MLKKLNFTERRRLGRNAVEITLRREADGVLAFDARLDLKGKRLDSDARVYVEAHRRTSYMRFDFGRVGAIEPPADRRLVEIESDNLVNFRVKIVDESSRFHRILAVAEGIRVSDREQDASSRMSLLPVEFVREMDEVWRVSFDSEGPALMLNSSIEGIESKARNDATFFALVYPAVVRQILTRIVMIDGYDEVDGDEWWGLWLRWAAEMLGEPAPASDDRDAREAWIDRVVAQFARNQNAAMRYQNAGADR